MNLLKLAVCLYKYFPFGGLSRDFLRIMVACLDRGYEIDVYTMAWQGDIPDRLHVHVLPVKGLTNHGKISKFIKRIQPKLKAGDYDLVIGFNKMPNLDVYYAADPCYLARIKHSPTYLLEKLSRRVQFYIKCERAVFGKTSHTVSLMISDAQRDLFKLHYGTIDNRLLILPPGIDKNRRRPDNWLEIRSKLRQQFGISDDSNLLLMVGTAFKTKGVDRAICALAMLPKDIIKKTKLLVIGDGPASPYHQMMSRYKVSKQVQFLGGRTDVPDFLLAADVLLHPARKDNTGTVILEAIVAGLPVLATDVCGYAKHVIAASAGMVISSPFKQDEFNIKLRHMLQTDKRDWSDHALAYAAREDLYGMPEKAADIIDKLTQRKQV